MGYTEKVIISWDKLEQDCRALAIEIQKNGEVPEKMLAITRGGLIVAGLVCRVLDIKEIETIGIESYHGQSQTEDVAILKKADSKFLENTLIIDDLVDTGKTFEYLKDKTQNCTFACVYAKPKGQAHTDFYVGDFGQSEWVEFPWETFEDN